MATKQEHLPQKVKVIQSLTEGIAKNNAVKINPNITKTATLPPPKPKK